MSTEAGQGQNTTSNGDAFGRNPFTDTNCSPAGGTGADGGAGAVATVVVVDGEVVDVLDVDPAARASGTLVDVMASPTAGALDDATDTASGAASTTGR